MGRGGQNKGARAQQRRGSKDLKSRSGLGTLKAWRAPGMGKETGYGLGTVTASLETPLCTGMSPEQSSP